jgi:membrane protease YdiL (CAAX protease family)
VLGFGAVLLATSILGMIAVRAFKAPAVEVSLALTLADAAVVVAHATTHRRIIARLVGRLEVGCALARDLALAGIALGAVVPAYFEVVRRMGFEVERVVEPYVARGWSPWSIYALICVAPAAVEEVAFRGLAMERLGRVVSSREAWVVQAAMFAVLHLSPVIFPSHFVIGLLLGWVRRRTQSLYPGMIVHATYNAVIVTAEFAS